MACFADAERQVTGAAAHGCQHEPVAARAGVDVDGTADDGAFVLGRFVAERRRALRQGQVVVDGLRYVDVGDGILLALQELGDAVGRRGRVVAAHRDEQFDVVFGEEPEVEVVFEIRILRFEAAHLQERTALVEDAVGHGVVDVHGAGIGDEETRIAFVQADYAVAMVQEGLGHAAYYGVHAGSRAAAGQNSNSFFHDRIGILRFVFRRPKIRFFFHSGKKNAARAGGEGGFRFAGVAMQGAAERCAAQKRKRGLRWGDLSDG